MKTILILMTLLACSCSLLEKRRSHFSYAKPGVSLEEVKQKSGDPIHESFDQDETVLTYDYCRASWAKEAAYGLLTATMYNWHCDKQKQQMHLYFKSGALYRTEDGSSIYERVHRKEQSFSDKAPVQKIPQAASN
jgi:hypothetical protein